MTRLTVWLAAITPIVSWVAEVTPAGAAPPRHGLPLAEAREQTPVTAFAFDPPPSGTWVLAVSVWFDGGAGSATYSWHLIVAP